MADFRKMIPAANRRTFIRMKTDVPIRYAAVTPREAVLKQLLLPHRFRIGILLDISGGGLRMLADTGIMEGSYLAIECILPTFSDGVASMFGLVLHKESGRAPGKEIVRLRFEKIDSAVQDQIIKFIFDQQAKK